MTAVMLTLQLGDFTKINVFLAPSEGENTQSSETDQHDTGVSGTRASLQEHTAQGRPACVKSPAPALAAPGDDSQPQPHHSHRRHPDGAATLQYAAPKRISRPQRGPDDRHRADEGERGQRESCR